MTKGVTVAHKVNLVGPHQVFGQQKADSSRGTACSDHGVILQDGSGIRDRRNKVNIVHMANEVRSRK